MFPGFFRNWFCPFFLLICIGGGSWWECDWANRYLKSCEVNCWRMTGWYYLMLLLFSMFLICIRERLFVGVIYVGDFAELSGDPYFFQLVICCFCFAYSYFDIIICTAYGVDFNAKVFKYFYFFNISALLDQSRWWWSSLLFILRPVVAAVF